MYCCKMADIYGQFLPWATVPGDRAREGWRDLLDGKGREGEEKSAVNDYRCKMAVCWTEFTLGFGFGKP